MRAKVVLRNSRAREAFACDADCLLVGVATHIAVRHVGVAAGFLALLVMSVERVHVMVVLGAARARRRGGGLGRFGLLAHVRVLREDAADAETQSKSEREHGAGFFSHDKFLL